MRSHTTQLKSASDRMVRQPRPLRFDDLQRHRAAPDFFVGLVVALPLALMAWAVLALMIWQVAR